MCRFRCVRSLFMLWALGLPGVSVCLAGVVPVALDPSLDQFGTQIETIQDYQWGTVSSPMFGIYDTGASVMTAALPDPLLVLLGLGGDPLPVKVASGASAQAVGGTVVGDVSQPVTALADGIHAFSIEALLTDPSSASLFDMQQAAAVPGVQVFSATEDGSPSLPTLTGTPIHNSGKAAHINMRYVMDLSSLLPDLLIPMPDLRFVPPGTKPTADATTGAPVRIPLTLVGDNNHPNPGDSVTVSPNPVQPSVVLSTADPTGGPARTVAQQRFLFDTGAQLTIISSAAAQALGLDLTNPDPNNTIQVQGAAGTVSSIPGYTIATLEVPCDNTGSGTADSTLQFQNVPVYVADLGVDGIDGIMGMNLWNLAAEMVYDPFDAAGPSLTATFLNGRSTDLSNDPLAGLEQLQELGLGVSSAAVLGHSVPNYASMTGPLTPVSVAAGKTFDLAGNGRIVGPLGGAGRVTLGSADLTVNSTATGGTADSTFSGSISGDGGLIKIGEGRLVLSGMNTYQGGTILDQGTLEIANAEAVPDGGSLTIGRGAKVVLACGIIAGGVSAATAASPVPEPGTWALLMAGAIAAIVWLPRRV
jgi:autotransporter-associated beta strand protein